MVTKQVLLCKKTHIEALSSIFLVLLMIMLTSISLVSAQDGCSAYDEYDGGSSCWQTCFNGSVVSANWLRPYEWINFNKDAQPTIRYLQLPAYYPLLTEANLNLSGYMLSNWTVYNFHGEKMSGAYLDSIFNDYLYGDWLSWDEVNNNWLTKSGSSQASQWDIKIYDEDFNSPLSTIDVATREIGLTVTNESYVSLLGYPATGISEYYYDGTLRDTFDMSSWRGDDFGSASNIVYNNETDQFLVSSTNSPYLFYIVNRTGGYVANYSKPAEIGAGSGVLELAYSKGRYYYGVFASETGDVVIANSSNASQVLGNITIPNCYESDGAGDWSIAGLLYRKGYLYVTCHNDTDWDTPDEYGYTKNDGVFIIPIDANSNVTDPYIKVGSTVLWNYTGLFNQSGNYTDDLASLINPYIEAGTYLLGDFHYIPFEFYSGTTGMDANFPMIYNNLNFQTTGIIEVNQTFNNLSYETSPENFIINLSYDNVYYTNIVANLIYNETSTLGTKIGSGINVEFSADTFSPLVTIPTIKEFYWEIALTNDVGTIIYINSTSNNQTVNPILFRLCNVTVNVSYLNFTFEDELLGTATNGTFEATFNLRDSEGTDMQKSYSFQNLTTNPSYAFCVYPSHLDINVNMNAQYDGGTYVDKTYYLNDATLTNITNEITLYQLNESDAVKFFITVKDGIEGFAEATVTITKLFVGEGVYKTVGIRETDDDGEFIEYLELDQDYKFAITRNGVNYGVIDRTSTCAEAPCEIILQIERAGSDLWEGFNEYYAGNVEYYFIWNDTSKTASLTFVDTTGLAQYMRFQVEEISMNSTQYVICNDTLYSSSGTMTCDLTGESGDFKATAFLSRSPEKLVDVWHFVISLIKDTLGFEGVLIALFLIITIALVGAWSPVAGIVLTTFAVMMMKILGFVAFAWTTVTLLFILAIILIVKIKQ